MFRFQQERILTCDLMEMGHVWISQKVNFQICLDGNASPDSRKSDFPDLCGWTWDMSGFQKKRIDRSVWGKIGHVQIPADVNFQICWGRSVWGEIGPVWIPADVNFQICWGGNGACPYVGKREFPYLIGWKWDMSGVRKK